MSTLVLSANVSNPDAEDKVAMVQMITQENARRLLADPPLPVLPFSTAAERKNSYETILSGILTSAHASYVQQYKSTDGLLRGGFTNAEIATINAALVTRLQNGEPKANILADVAG